MSTITPQERQELAAQLGCNEQYLYQCLTGRKNLDAAEAKRLESLSDFRIRVWHVRNDWYEIWPDLIGTEGAPSPEARAA